MSGYRWDPVFRVSPVNGGDTYYWLSDRLSDVGSHTRINLRYVESMNTREDVNRSLRPVVFGLRPEVDITCAIWTMADQAFLSEIESALLDTSYYRVYLSLDGGVVYRQVVMASATNAEPINGKTIVGAQFTIRVRCVDLITRRPAMATDPGVGEELAQNIGFEQWVSSSSPFSWSATGGIITIAQQSTAGYFRSGTYSAQCTRSDGSTFGQFVHSLSKQPNRGAWYRAQAYHRGSIAMALNGSNNGPLRMQIGSSTQDIYVGSDGKTYSSSGALVVAGTATTFALAEGYFRMPTTIPTTDQMVFRLSGYYTGSESLYYDDVSLYGPVLRPGVSTW